ncbi:MAG: hypothetical protein CSA58_04715 [Micrococcales bacterium]|nr:MAG: hypothetical protein CSA58_04715 [Micrococcales bacterium]
MGPEAHWLPAVAGAALFVLVIASGRRPLLIRHFMGGQQRGGRRPAGRSWRRGGRAGAEPAEPAELIAQLAGVLGAGVSPAQAWSLVAEQAGHDDFGARLRAAAAQVAAGRSPTAALCQATEPGDPARVLGVGWDVLAGSGAAAGPALGSLAESLRAQQRAAAAKKVALAAPVATARVLAFLPVLGLGLGFAAGADPLQVLFTTQAGRYSAAAAAGFAVCGAVWTRWLVRGVNS